MQIFYGRAAQSADEMLHRLFCRLWFYLYNHRESWKAVMDTKPWFRTASEYSQRTTFFLKLFWKVTNNVLNESEDKYVYTEKLGSEAFSL